MQFMEHWPGWVYVNRAHDVQVCREHRAIVRVQGQLLRVADRARYRGLRIPCPTCQCHTRNRDWETPLYLTGPLLQLPNRNVERILAHDDYFTERLASELDPRESWGDDPADYDPDQNEPVF